MNDEKIEMSETKVAEVKRLARRAEVAVRQLAAVIAMPEDGVAKLHARRVKTNEYMGRYFREGREARRAVKASKVTP